METNFESMGRNYWQNSCGFPRCDYLKGSAERSGGWCTNPFNRRAYGTPSVCSTGGCDLHTSSVTIKIKDNV